MIYLIVSLLSLVEWYLSAKRIGCIARGQIIQAATIAFIEEMLGFVVIYYAIIEKDWLIAGFSALGGSIGVILSMRGKWSKSENRN